MDSPVPDEKHKKMMSQGSEISVTVKGQSGKASSGQVRLQVWDRKARMIRALQYLGIFWGLSLASVLIPLAHFILVPCLFLAGPIVAWIVSNQEKVILGGQSTCPECGSFFPIARTADQWPISDLCTHCHRNVSIEKSA